MTTKLAVQWASSRKRRKRYRRQRKLAAGGERLTPSPRPLFFAPGGLGGDPAQPSRSDLALIRIAVSRDWLIDADDAKKRKLLRYLFDIVTHPDAKPRNQIAAFRGFLAAYQANLRIEDAARAAEKIELERQQNARQ